MAGAIKCSRCGREIFDGVQLCSYGGPCSADVSRVQGETGPIDGALAGLKLGSYLVKELIGTGGMGEVYAGEQLVIGKRVAIKVLRTRAAADQTAMDRMLAEARAVAAIGHRGIVDIYDFGTLHDGRPYLVMEYLEGMRLDRVMRRQPPLRLEQIVSLLADICVPLTAAHARGIVHRDLKPQNIVVMNDETTKEQYVKLLDFGLAKDKLAPIGTGPTTKDGFVVGTPDYIAPEQARGTELSPKSDLYSLGVVAYELVAHRLPFAAGSPTEMMTRHVYAPVPHVSSIAPECSPQLDSLIFQLMSKRPEDRPPSAESVRRSLLGLKPLLGGSNDIPVTAVEVSPFKTDSVTALTAIEDITQSGKSGTSSTSLSLANVRHQLWKYRRLVGAVAGVAGVLGILIGRCSR